MTRQDYVNRIIEMAADQMGYDPAGLSEDTTFVEDLGADSLELVEMIMSLETEFGVEIPEDSVESVKTIGDIADVLASLK